MRRNILITGASAGLGEETARQLAAKGHNLALTARREDRLDALRKDLTAEHPQLEIVVHKLDVNDHDQVFETFRKADAELGQLDRIIVNAGLGKGAAHRSAPAGSTRTGRPR
jgi:short-subunit dehydrogenase